VLPRTRADNSGSLWRSYEVDPPQRSYSKLANVLFTYELARWLPASAVTANALHPGVVRTSFGADDPAGVQRLFLPLVRPFMKTPAQGATTSIRLASSPDVEGVTGR